MSNFPLDFLWGAATSAYQIEGSPLADGAGASNWHRFAHTPGRISDGSNGDVACDHYRRFAEDIVLMRELGLRAYRFSTSWSRVLPVGVGPVNQAGVDFYSRLIDVLLEHNIQPMLTLFHWDLPAALEDRGGWTNPESVEWFATYARHMFRSLGDRVTSWVTINEPWVIVDAGYVAGLHPPAQRDPAAAALVAKHLLLAHAAAVSAMRAEWKHQIGLVVNLVPIYTATEMPTDRLAADRFDAYLNRQFLDPVLLGRVPPELPTMFGAAWPEWSANELDKVQQPVDFVGINYYLRLVVRDDPSAGPAGAQPVRQAGRRQTAMGWEIYPSGLTDILQWFRSRYGNLPLYITENGAAFDDEMSAKNIIHDVPRIEYIKEHLQAAGRAIEAGVNLRGYFVWSLVDNFEWQFGFLKRFGIVAVDRLTQRRIPKNSARYYADVIRTNGAAVRD